MQVVLIQLTLFYIQLYIDVLTLDIQLDILRKKEVILSMLDNQKKYIEIVNYINNLIDTKQLIDGDKLYSENELSCMFSVSRQTARHAIQILEEERKVRRIRGSETYITETPKIDLSKRNRIAVVTTYVDSYIFPKTIQGIEKVLFEKGFSVQIAFTNNTLEREKSVLEDIIARQDVAGVIVEGTKSGLPNPNIPLYKKLIENQIPIIFINTYYPELEVPHISLNDTQAARTAVNYLIEKGHSTIGAILKLDDGQGRLRYLGYMNAMQEAGLTMNDSHMVWIDTDDSLQLSLCMDKIMARIGECSAVLCYNDQIAFQLVRLCRAKGMDIPRDLSIISIDDSDLAIHSEVQLTSLPHPKEKLGERAATNLCELILGETRDFTYEFPTRVIERCTVSNPKG